MLLGALVVALIAGGIADGRRRDRELAECVRKMVEEGGYFDLSDWHPITQLALECQIKAHGGRSRRQGFGIYVEKIG